MHVNSFKEIVRDIDKHLGGDAFEIVVVTNSSKTYIGEFSVFIDGISHIQNQGDMIIVVGDTYITVSAIESVKVY